MVLALAPSAILHSADRKQERATIERRRKEFDDALDHLRLAKDRLRRATDVYLERLEGNKDDAKRTS